MALLWPERDAASARRLLNLAVHVLRSALGDETIASTGDALLLNPTHFRCDLHDLRTSIAAGSPDEIVRLYAGPLLDGFHLPESTEFGYWLDEHRSELEHAFVGALRAVAKRQESVGDVHGLVGTCRRLVSIDPYSATNALSLMRALDAAGDRAAAIQHAQEFAQRLRADLEIEPDSSVLALAEQLRSAPAQAAASAPGPSRQQRRRRVAVLPFMNLSADVETEAFADGITEDLIAHLAKMRALEVIGTTSVMAMKDRPRHLPEIGAALGASIVLDGSVRRSRDRVRIVAKLIDVAADTHLWAETYDRKLTDIFAVQTDVALHIAAALEAELSTDERSRVRRQPTKDVLAYQLFQQGRQAFIKFTPESMQRAIEYFEAALARDPDFALAAAHMGMAYVELCENGAIGADLARARATELTALAIRVDPELSAAHCTLAHLRTVLEYDWQGAELSFKRAIELSPSNADAHALYGRMCAALERYDESIALHARARELDPLAHRIDIVTALLRAGRYDEAVPLGEAMRDFNPGYARAHATLGWAYFLKGRYADGLGELERAVALSGHELLWLSQLGEAYGMAGELEKARAIERELEERARVGYVSPYYFAYVATGLGDAQRAIDWLERAVAQRTGPAYGIRGSFLLAPLHGHPRFKELLACLESSRV